MENELKDNTINLNSDVINDPVITSVRVSEENIDIHKSDLNIIEYAGSSCVPNENDLLLSNMEKLKNLSGISKGYLHFDFWSAYIKCKKNSQNIFPVTRHMNENHSRIIDLTGSTLIVYKYYNSTFKFRYSKTRRNSRKTGIVIKKKLNDCLKLLYNDCCIYRSEYDSLDNIEVEKFENKQIYDRIFKHNYKIYEVEINDDDILVYKENCCYVTKVKLLKLFNTDELIKLVQQYNRGVYDYGLH
jgi:hypothetical protein